MIVLADKVKYLLEKLRFENNGELRAGDWKMIKKSIEFNLIPDENKEYNVKMFHNETF